MSGQMAPCGCGCWKQEGPRTRSVEMTRTLLFPVFLHLLYYKIEVAPTPLMRIELKLFSLLPTSFQQEDHDIQHVGIYGRLGMVRRAGHTVAGHVTHQEE
jgi:hypothetical protein